MTDSLSGISFVVILLSSVFNLKILFLAGYPGIRPPGYPLNVAGYPSGYRLLKKSQISGATLFYSPGSGLTPDPYSSNFVESDPNQ